MSESEIAALGACPRPWRSSGRRCLADDDLQALCEAADAAIIDGGGFGWIEPPGRTALESYFRGVLLVPERELFVGRMDGIIVGSAQLVRPPRNNEAQAFAASLMHSFVAPYARGHGIGPADHPAGGGRGARARLSDAEPGRAGDANRGDQALRGFRLPALGRAIRPMPGWAARSYAALFYCKKLRDGR